MENRKRVICHHCTRPKEGGCICSALPKDAVALKRCHCLVLQHPHECKRKTRSLPFLELCLSNESMTIAVARDIGRTVEESNFLRKLHDSDTCLWLIYPSDDAISLQEALRQWKEGNQEMEKMCSGNVILFVLDGTWKFAKEMDTCNRIKNYYPDHMIRVQLTKDDMQELAKPKRFDIRTPPSEQHLSTAETLAWIVSKVEEDDSIYEILIRPLDLMVKQWHSFQEQSRSNS